MDLDHAVHWILNDGSSVGMLLLFMLASSITVFFGARGRKKMLTTSRAGHDMEEFVREMKAAGHNEEVSREVYLYIEEHYGIDFPILPTDNLCMMLGITDDSVQYVMLPALLKRSGRAPRLGRLMMPLETVANLVDFVERAPLGTEYVREWQTA